MRSCIQALALFSAALLTLHACTRDRAEPLYQGFPAKVGRIFAGNCGVSGCHNAASKDACAGLELTSWDKLFEGTANNSCVIPFRPDLSTLFFSINTFPDLGPALSPTMPVNRPALSREEVILIRDWIAAGAPNDKGFVKWSDDPGRHKIYVANQGCDLITVFDSKTRLIMRAIDAGNTPATEAPHDMFVSPDGNYLYISFFTSNVFQKFRTSDDTKVGELNLPDISWHSMAISGNSQRALVSHLSADGVVSLLDLGSMSILQTYQGTGFLVYPHGCTLNYDGTVGYITSQQGNFIYKIGLSNPSSPDIAMIPLQTGDIPNPAGIYKPYEVDFTPDYTRYYVTCQGTNEVRIFDSGNDSLLQVIPTIGVPQTISFSETFPYAFIACMQDTANTSTQSGVSIVNTATLQAVSSLYTGPQPRGLIVDDEHQCVWVANRNISGVGWAPHHTTVCQGRAGYITLIDMNNLQMIPAWRTQVSVDPYQVAIKK
ncbi:MAG: YncE family protein [Bacteroidota bacterium]